MDHTALIWTLTILLALICGVLAADMIVRLKRDRKQQPKKKAAAMAVLNRIKIPDNKRELNGVDLCGREKPLFRVVLPPDGKVLHLTTPTKAVADQFEAIGSLLERLEKHRLSMDGIEQLFKFTAILLSNNKEGCGFMPADLKERMTTEDIYLLLTKYLVWLTDLVQSLN